MSKLTFLLPLKDRADYTRTWLEHNVRPDYDYYVADGSLGDENEAIFRKVNYPNITYVRYPNDLSSDCWVEKMFQSACRIQTEYVMTCDNDDFINYHGVAQCINALERDEGVVCAAGQIYNVAEKKSSNASTAYTLPVPGMCSAHLHNRTGFDAFSHLFTPYSYLWYSIYRTRVYREIWRDIKELRVSDIFLIEVLQSELTLCHGKYVQVEGNHYIRLCNPEQSSSRDAQVETLNEGLYFTHKIYFDDDYRSQVLRMSGRIAKLLGVDLQKLLQEFIGYYIRPPHPSFGARMYERVTRLYEIIPRHLGVYFPIEFGISFINWYGKHVRRHL